MGIVNIVLVLDTMTKHFFKVLTIFTAMIILGLLGVFVINYLDQKATQAIDVENTTQVAK